MKQSKFDLVVIGGGPGGYVAAIRAAQLGMKVACIDKRNFFGGTCLNVGCIPSKALLDSSEHYLQAKTKLQKHGVIVGQVQLDLSQMMKRKESVVRQLVIGVASLLKKNKVEAIRGEAKLLAKNGLDGQVEVVTDGVKKVFSASKILLATGSEPNSLPFLPFDGKTVLSSTEALELTSVPEHLVVVGGGVIGLELGSVWMRLGAKVTVIEFQNRICPGFDQQIGTELHKSLLKQGMQFKLATKCTGLTQKNSSGAVIHTVTLADGAQEDILCDKILVATGRKPYTQGLGLENIGLKTDQAGRVEVDAHYETQAPGVFAVGDLIAGPMLAHKAEEEGIAVVELMNKQAGHVNYNAIPNVIYTWPEVASVGFSEEELQAKGLSYKVGTFPFMANGRAKAMEESEGLAKVISEASTDRLLGVHIVGPWASDLISEAVSVIEFGGSAEDIARSCHAHPTLSETLKEAALAVAKRQIHF